MIALGTEDPKWLGRFLRSPGLPLAVYISQQGFGATLLPLARVRDHQADGHRICHGTCDRFPALVLMMTSFGTPSNANEPGQETWDIPSMRKIVNCRVFSNHT